MTKPCRFVSCVSVVAVAMWLTTVIGRAPSLGQEATALGSIRSVLSAERAFADASGGRFGGWPCLSANGRLSTSRFVSDLLTPDFGEKLTRAGYRLDLFGAPIGWAAQRDDAATLYSHFAVVAAPTGASSGRTFCADDTGHVLVNTPGRPTVIDGRCADRSAPLR